MLPASSLRQMIPAFSHCYDVPLMAFQRWCFCLRWPLRRRRLLRRRSHQFKRICAHVHRRRHINLIFRLYSHTRILYELNSPIIKLSKCTFLTSTFSRWNRNRRTRRCRCRYRYRCRCYNITAISLSINNGGGRLPLQQSFHFEDMLQLLSFWIKLAKCIFLHFRFYFAPIIKPHLFTFFWQTRMRHSPILSNYSTCTVTLAPCSLSNIDVIMHNSQFSLSTKVFDFLIFSVLNIRFFLLNFYLLFFLFLTS